MLITFSFYKTIIIFVLTACFVITSYHHPIYQHGLLSFLRKLQLRSRVVEDLLLETRLSPGVGGRAKESLLSTYSPVQWGSFVFWMGFSHQEKSNIPKKLLSGSEGRAAFSQPGPHPHSISVRWPWQLRMSSLIPKL